jgi:trehalose synthase
VLGILAKTGLIAPGSYPPPVFLRQDGTPAEVQGVSDVKSEGLPGAIDRVVVQVSRWDALKDPIGVIQGFAEHVAPQTDAHLMYAGPQCTAVSDDPEGMAVLDDSIAFWQGLPDDVRARVHLAQLPMDDGEENAAVVNALQRHAYVVVQKSLAEGFGLTVAEGMWKGRPVVASRIGGIQDQIEDGVTGILLDDPRDLAAYGAAVVDLLFHPDQAEAIGHAAMERVRDEFLGVRSLLQYMQLLSRMVSEG